MIRRTRSSVALCTALLVCNLLFIWGNSLMDGTASGALSQWVRDILGKLLGESDPGQGSGLLRKLAHFSEFCSLGLLLSWLFAMLKEKHWAFVLPAAAFGCLAACVDETLQAFTPGRAPRFTDVLIDTAGVLAGIGLLSLGYLIHRKQKTI